LAVLKEKLVAEALRELRGNLSAVARKFGVTREAVRRHVADRPSLQEVVRECREAMTDDAESSLYRAIDKGEGWAVCFYLKCIAKNRGYVEKEPDAPRGEDKSGVPVELVTKLFAMLGARSDPGGTGPAPGPVAVDAEPRPAEPGVPE
jgi:hypothetical protein